MTKFAFTTNESFDAYFERVVDVMVAEFGISNTEAVARINGVFGGTDVLADVTLMHEWARDLAYQIYYPGQMYWRTDIVLTPAPIP